MSEADEALERLEGLCQYWDALTKGESATTAAIRGAVRKPATDYPAEEVLF